MDRRTRRIWGRWLRQGWEGFCLVPTCPCCGERRREGEESGLCPPCAVELWRYEALNEEAPGGLSWGRAVWAYLGTGGRIVRRAKFVGDPGSISFLSQGMLRFLKNGGMPGGPLRGPWTVVPVPLSVRKRRRRGFNQAAELAWRIAGRMGWGFEGGALKRIRDTPSLGRVAKSERETLLAGAFRLGNWWRNRVRGRRILLVDDVITTGATQRACGAVLGEGGARQVMGLAACGARDS